MKVYWVVTTNFYPLWAGPSERFFRYAKLSEEKGLKLVFKTLDRGVGKSHEQMEGVDVYRYKTESYEELLANVSEEIEQGEKPDALVILGLHKDIDQFNKRVRARGVKSIYVSTMDFDLEYRDNGQKRGWLRKFFFVKLFKKMINSFDVIVSSSDFLKDQYAIKLNTPAKKLRTIPNGVNPNIFKPEPTLKSSLRKELNLPENEEVFLYVGLMVERKGVLELLKAWKAYKDKGGKGFLACVGAEKRSDGDEPFFQKYRELREELEGEKYKVHFFGASREIHKYFKASDVFVFMSRLEGMPNVLLEAMACGLPIILNKFKGFSSDYGQEGKHFVSVEVDNEKSITSALDKMAQKPDYRTEVGQNAIKLIQEEFLVEDSIVKYASLFN